MIDFCIFLFFLVSIVISLRLFLGLWVLKKHKDVSNIKKLFWSFCVFIPLVGAIFYGAFYKMPKKHENGGASPNDSAIAGYLI